MFNDVKESEKLNVEVLKAINEHGNLSILDSLYEPDKISEALYYCVENKFVNGYSARRVASGKIVFDVQDHTNVTHEGLLYIESFTGKETSVIAKHALKKANRADKKSSIALAAAIISLLSNLDNINRNVTSILVSLLDMIK